MALEAAFQTLVVQINKLRAELNVLLITLLDKPIDRESALADELEKVVLDILVAAEAARSTASAAAGAASFPSKLSHTRRALAKCQGEFDEVECQFLNRLDCRENLSNLASHGIERGQEWRLWARTMNSGIDAVRQPLEDARKAFTACWQEIAEHSDGTYNSVS